MAKLTKKGRSMLSIRKIREYFEHFDPPFFSEEALQIYIKAHEALVNFKEDEIFEYVTEKCYPEMMDFCESKTIRWKFIKSLEPPRIVHARHEDTGYGYVFAQVTLRINSQQILAVYDRFGRLVHGGEAVIKDVLEYVVFENQLSNIYGKWRIHGKIIPDWMPKREPIRHTFVKPDIPKPPSSKSTKATSKSEENDKKYEKDEKLSDVSESPTLATS